jgi:hypothetical protein
VRRCDAGLNSERAATIIRRVSELVKSSVPLSHSWQSSKNVEYQRLPFRRYSLEVQLDLCQQEKD